MTTRYGLNPSFLMSTRGQLPLLRDAVKRAPRFEVFSDTGQPIGETSPLGPAGLPARDGRLHGVKLFSGRAPDLGSLFPIGGVTVRSAGNLTVAFKREWNGSEKVLLPGSRLTDPWHRPSLELLASLRPDVIRTLDLSMANEPMTLPRITPTSPLQGTLRGMAVELQADLARRLRCNLWWNAPPRYELSESDYAVRVSEVLRAVADPARPPILEYGNELWNEGFAVNRWLKQQAREGETWHHAAAREIAALDREARSALGAGYYLFVGGQLTVPFHLDRVLQLLAELGVTPHSAGPALYAPPLRDDVAQWRAESIIPSQQQLESSCHYQLSLKGVPGLRAHRQICEQRGVQFFTVYEAGQSLLAGAARWRQAMIEAQGSAWLGDLYRRLRAEAESADVDLLCWYSACTDQAPADPRVPGVFGLTGWPGEPLPPKALAARGD